jgi:peptidoglycan/LPS O-acetylase OafA/YrhL
MNPNQNINNLESTEQSVKLHFYWLDLLRFLAAFIVFACHCRGYFMTEYALLPHSQQNIATKSFYFITRLGQESVLVFFVMSGFFVGGRALEKMMYAKINITSYFIDRFVRIFVPLITSLILVIIIDLVIGEQVPLIHILGSIFSLQGIWTNCTFNEPLWSLAYEVWFYVLMGCFMSIFSNTKTKILFFFIAIFVFMIFTKLNPMYLFIWILGTITYILPIKSSKYQIFYVIPIFILIILLQLTSASNVKLNNVWATNLLNYNFLCILFGGIFCLFIKHIINIKPTKTGLKINNIGTKLASFSYTLYLSHVPILLLLRHLKYPKSSDVGIYSLMLYCCLLFIGLLMSYIIYLFSEKHTDAIKIIIKKYIQKSTT